ncbi:MAG: S8 family serine peptidase, partial [Marinirhabdus sp.]
MTNYFKSILPMNIIKFSLPATATAILLASCTATVAPIVSTPIENIDTVPLKTRPLTDAEQRNWGNTDLTADTIPGMSIHRAYDEIIKNRKGQTVIVGVIDSGVDIEHEDLKNVIWTNPKEIAGNGKDDDKNGYVDDIHGWNFLGDIVGENMEYTRYVRTLGAKYAGVSESPVSAADRAEFETYKKAKAEYDKEHQQTLAQSQRYQGMLQQITPAHAAMAKKLGKENYTKKDLAGIADPTDAEKQQITALTQMLSFGDSVPEILKQLKNGADYFNGRLETHFNTKKDFRAVLNDDPNNPATKNYGNNDVDGPDAKKADARHGTHVAGIIAAQRTNNIGMDGVANNVKIMVVRAVPDGDEYDKDIANAIRYAADNGAKIINTSFGKYFSTHPDWVRDAIKYAASKDVLIVNAAGNEAFNLDTVEVYPNDQRMTGAEYTDNMLTVGALNFKYGGTMVANFSNYGKSNVDVFAPGVKIY